eukprot:SAG31_NODE_4700_length_3024_cov_2.572308_5_plen_35_part_01
MFTQQVIKTGKTSDTPLVYSFGKITRLYNQSSVYA